MSARKTVVAALFLAVCFIVAVPGAEAGNAIGLEKEGHRGALSEQQQVPWENRLAIGIAELIETNNEEDAGYPQVAVDPLGNAVAVWAQYDGTRVNIWANRYAVGTGWGIAELIETNNEGDTGIPQVAIDASGNAVAVWHQSDGIRDNIWANRYAVGTGWGTAELIESDEGGARSPEVAIDPMGNAVAVWHQRDGARLNVWANRYTAGTDWGTAELIVTDNVDAFHPEVAIDASGNAVAVWEQSDGARFNIWANRYTADTGWGTAELIETDNAGFAASPQVAVDPSGNAVAVWFQDDGTRLNILANTFNPVTGWGSAMLIETDNGGASSPEVTVDESGNAVAVWRQHDGTRSNIWANRYTVDEGWGTAELIETDNGDADLPQVAVDPWGYAVAVWEQYDGIRNNIWINSYTASAGWGIAELIETDDGTADLPQVAVDPSGNVVAVWGQDDGSRLNIWANRFSLHATYSPGSGILAIPELQLGGAQLKAQAVTKAFDIELTRLNEPGYVYKLTNYEKIAATNNPSATYNPATEVLDIPFLEVQGKNVSFHATFKKRAGAYTFDLTSAGKN